MKTYCIKCKKDAENIDPKIVRTKNNRLVMQSKGKLFKTTKNFIYSWKSSEYLHCL